MEIVERPFGTHLIRFIHGDCNDWLEQCPKYGLANVDPPYFEGPNKTGYYGTGFSNIGVKRNKHYDTIEEDCWQLPDKKYFDQLKIKSDNQIIWGANHYSGVFDSSSPSWIVWDKDNGKSSFADAELAYTSFGTAVRIFKYMWNGMHQGSFGGDVSKNEKRIHPTQKPVILYEWTLMKYAKKGDTILDTHGGSGSHAIACHKLKFSLDIVEKNEKCFRAMVERFDQHVSQLTLF